MKAAILSGGPSIYEHLPFDREGYDIVVAVNYAGEHVPDADHWAAIDWGREEIREMFPHWRVDWDRKKMRPGSEILKSENGEWVGELTFPLALEYLIRTYDPDTIDAFGVDMDGIGLCGMRHKENHWERERSLLAKMDLTRVTWHGAWRP